MRPPLAVLPLLLALVLPLNPALAASALGGPAWPRAPHDSKEGAAVCVEDGTTLCLLGGRYAVSVAWRNQYNGTFGFGGALPYADVSGFFWFDDAANLELVVKIIEFDGVVKVFYSQLTDLDFTMTVRDLATGYSKEYGPGPDNCGAIDQDFNAGSAGIGLLARKRGKRAHLKAGTCVTDGDTLCLYDNRFAVEVDWRNQFSGESGPGLGVQLSNLSGLFHYGDERNVELVVKTLDFGANVLFLYGALSDLEYTIRVTDTISGNVKSYYNAGGRYCGGIDNELAPGSGETPEVEPNDRVAQAQVLPTLPVVVNGTADVEDLGELQNTTFGDDLEDLYEITLTQPGVTIALTGLTADCDIYVIDGGVTRFVAQSAGPGTRDEQLLLPGLAAGKYYVAVSIFDAEPGATSSSPYRLRIDGTAAAAVVP